jgi:hypothetical protein
MSRYTNIERSVFRHREYVGYGGGVVWRIRRFGRSGWHACPSNPEVIYMPTVKATLREVSEYLEAF